MLASVQLSRVGIYLLLILEGTSRKCVRVRVGIYFADGLFFKSASNKQSKERGNREVLNKGIV